MNVCSQQPNLLPWAGFWNKLHQCDKFILIAGVDYCHQDFQNRVKIQGVWMSLPINHRTRFGPINQAEYLSLDVLRQAAVRIEKTFCMKKYKYHHRLSSLLSLLKSTTNTNLYEVNRNLLEWGIKELGITVDVITDHVPSNDNLTKTQNFAVQVLRNAESPLTYYAGSGTLSFLYRQGVPFPIMEQVLPENFNGDSILQSIASEPDVMDYVKNFCTWRKW